MRWLHRAAVMALLVCSTPSLALADAPEDTVMLKSGGRVRGIIVDEVGDGTVRIKLATGEVRTIPKEDVAFVRYGGAPAAPASATAPTAVVPDADAFLVVGPALTPAAFHFGDLSGFDAGTAIELNVSQTPFAATRCAFGFVL